MPLMRLAVPSRGSTVRLTKTSGFSRWIIAALLLVVAFSVVPLLLVGDPSQVESAACLGCLFMFPPRTSLGSSPGMQSKYCSAAALSEFSITMQHEHTAALFHFSPMFSS